jgi:hypothetical protein
MRNFLKIDLIITIGKKTYYPLKAVAVYVYASSSQEKTSKINNINNSTEQPYFISTII